MKKLLSVWMMVLGLTSFSQVIPNKDLVVQALSPTGADVTGLATAVDYTTGAVYTCGYINTISNGRDLIVVKLDSNLVQQWVATYDFASLDDKANSICIDGGGNVYVTGSSAQGVGNGDLVTIKYNSSGTQQWVSRINGTNNTNDQGNSILFDGSDVWVTGYVTTSGKGKDAIILKLNGSSGATIYQPKRNGTANGDDIGERICTDGTSVFITGTTKNTTTNGDVFATCVNISAGTLTWSISVNGTANSDDSGLDCKIDNGELYLCGYTNNSSTGNDYYFARINKSNGTIKYSDTYDGGYNGSDMASSFVPDKLGKYAVTGFITNGSNNEYHTRLYDTSSVLWTQVQPINGTYTTSYPKIALDTIAQHFYVCGGYYSGTLDGILYQLAPSGNKKWTQYHNGTNGARDIFTDLVVDGLGRIFVCSPNETSTTNVYDYMVIRYSQTPVYMPVNYNMASDTFSFAHLFYPNSGEIVDTSRSTVSSVLFYSKFTSPMEFIQKNKVSYCFYKNDTAKVTPSDTISRIDMSFVGANEFSEIFATDYQSKTKLNYFLDYTGSSGLTNVKGASHLICPNIYPMIDLHYSSNINGAKYYFVVKPTGDPANIRLYFDGAISTSTISGSLKIKSEIGEIVFKRPDVYNVSVPSWTNLTISTTSVTGNARWVSMGSDTYSIDPGIYDSTRPLIIEFDLGKMASPMDIQNIKWSTYVGSGANDWVFESRCDVDNNLFVVGETFATAFPQNPGVTQVYDPSFNGGNGLSDGFIAKFDTIGYLEWSTYIGGAQADFLKDLDFHSNKDIYCIGTTKSAGLPLQTPGGAYTQAKAQLFDGMIFAIKQDGFTNPWLTYFGGNSDDYFYGCKFDYNDNLFIVGGTKSTNLPVSGPGGSYSSNYNRTRGQSCDSCWFDAYIVKFDNSLARLWSTYVGSDTINDPSTQSPSDAFLDVCLEEFPETPPQKVYVTGHSGSFNYPTLVNGGSTNHNWKNRQDAIVTQFSNAGQMQYSTYFGSSYFDYGNGITHKGGKLYVTGIVGDLDFPTDSSGSYYYQRHKGLNDAFFIIMNGSTDIVQHASYLGGTANDEGSDVVVDNNGIIYLTGETQSSNFPIPPSQPANTYFHTYRGAVDCYVCALEFSNQNLDWSTFLGGTDYENAVFDARFATICIDNKNHLYLGSSSRSDSAQKFPLDDGGGFPTYFDPIKKGLWDGTITKFDLIPLLTIGIKENKLSFDGVSVYPNPTNSVLYIKLKEGLENVNYRVYDVSGKMVGVGKLFSNFNSISVNNLTGGMYFIEIFDSNTRSSMKFVKYD